MYRSITLGSFSREVYVGHGQAGYFVRNENGSSSRQQGIILALWWGQSSAPRQALYAGRVQGRTGASTTKLCELIIGIRHSSQRHISLE